MIQHQYNLLLALALTAHTKGVHSESHTVTDALIDLEDYQLISHDERLYREAEPLDKLSQDEILEHIISIANQLKTKEIKAV
jgi:hypothetical protein